MSTIDKIKQYGRRLEKHADDKMLLKETLHKLDRIEVSVDILQQTGIGKVVNYIKKRGDSVGVMATDLIRKWRKVVDREAEVAEMDVEGKSAADDTSKSKKSSAQQVNSSNNNIKASRHSKSVNEVPREPELFSDAVLAVKKQVKEESCSRHSKDSKTSRSSSKDQRKVTNSHSSQHKDDDSAKRSHKDEVKCKKEDKIDKSQQRTVPKTAEACRDVGTTVKGVKPSAVQESSIKQEAGVAKEKDRHRKRKPDEEGTEEVEGMNAQNFGSFEDCLGSIDPKKQKKKKRFNTPCKSTSSGASPKMTVTSSTLNGSISKPKGPRLPDLLDSKKISESPSNLLPASQLVTDYKPLPRVEPKPSATSVSAAGSARRTMTNEEAVMFTTSRKDRTAVYSGRKQPSLSTVPTLYEACVRVLVEHVDLIDETGGVPFEIMRPIMERCTWQQLYRLEYYNPNLTEDSDPLWETHVRRDFRGKTPAKGEETWRELYLRCHDEREQKLKDLKESISQSMKAKQAPVRMTKLAYVDSMAKPPRNVQRAQLKHGTQVANRAKPSQARSIAAQASTSAASEPVRAPTTAAKKPNKPAPLMAKTLMFLKMRKTTGYGFASR